MIRNVRVRTNTVVNLIYTNKNQKLVQLIRYLLRNMYKIAALIVNQVDNSAVNTFVNWSSSFNLILMSYLE